MFGNRGLYHQGWSAVTKHSLPWVVADLPAFDDDAWELYGPDDWTQAQNIAQENPDQLAHLQRLWLIEATKYHVLPLDDRRVERFNSDLAGRPTLIRGNTQLLFGGMGRLGEGSVVNVKNKSHAVTAEVVVPEGSASGVIVAQGSSTGGWSLYAKDGRLAYCYNYLGLDHSIIAADQPLPAGARQVRMEFAYDGGGVGKGGAVTLYVDGQSVGSGRVAATQSMIFSDETCDVGQDFGSPVSPDYGPRGNAFTGAVTWVQIDLERDDHDHLISPEERFQVAMAKQ
jgi:arylsulfatase